MLCPLCGTRRARRGCPALGHQICAVCCGTKRLVQIACPADCAWLASAREHPPAVAVRQQQRDVGVLLQVIRDFSERQSQLFLLISTFLVRYEAPELQPLIDDDVAEAMAALAATFETSARGVIYEHRPGSLPAERLVGGLKQLLVEGGPGARHPAAAAAPGGAAGGGREAAGGRGRPRSRHAVRARCRGRPAARRRGGA